MRHVKQEILLMKRLVDITLSTISLIVLSPLFFAVAIFIKFDSPGPVFFKGIRIGKNGIPFRIYKFRTMVVNAEELGGPSTPADDPRLTRVGKILRKYNLDELPQFINVFKGEMSIVGPRPEVPQYVEMFSEKEKEILTVHPGITDWASLWNPDEGAVLAGSNDAEKVYFEKIWPEKHRLELEYVRNCSPWTDVKIIFLTFKTHLLKPIFYTVIAKKGS
jgi:lipopolysaccharide/colanic/teichoic acid biosynthesis glycosyltransferase